MKSRMSPYQRRREQRRKIALAEKAVEKAGPGTNHGQGWGNQFDKREIVGAVDHAGSITFSPGAYRVPRKPGAE